VYFALLPWMLVLGMGAPAFYAGFGPAARIPFGWQVAIVFVLADFLSYWQHRWFHSRALWPIHAVHHSSRRLDWLSSGRFHPLNEIGVQLVNVVPVLACGFDVRTFLVLAPFTTWYVVFLHSNVRWRFGPLAYAIASPPSTAGTTRAPTKAATRTSAASWPFGTSCSERSICPTATRLRSVRTTPCRTASSGSSRTRCSRRAGSAVHEAGIANALRMAASTSS
jgi:hypothetical protein